MCSVNFALDFKFGFGIKHKSLIFYLLALALCGATIFIGGLASMQNECLDDGIYEGNTASLTGIDGFSASVLTCKKIYRYYWFIVAFEYIAAFIGLYAVFAGKVASLKGSIQGLFIIASLLFIYTSNSFLGVLSVPLFQSETLRDRSKTAVAGAIITATLNTALVFVAGYQQ